jgi:hypothetical protein
MLISSKIRPFAESYSVIEQFLQRKAAHVNTPKRNLVASTVLGLLVVVAVLALAGVSVAGNGKGKGHHKGHAKTAKSASSAEYQYGSGGDQYKNHKVLICHKGHTISVDQHAVNAHLTHHDGDHLGAC